MTKCRSVQGPSRQPGRLVTGLGDVASNLLKCSLPRLPTSCRAILAGDLHRLSAERVCTADVLQSMPTRVIFHRESLVPYQSLTAVRICKASVVLSSSVLR